MYVCLYVLQFYCVALCVDVLYAFVWLMVIVCSLCTSHGLHYIHKSIALIITIGTSPTLSLFLPLCLFLSLCLINSDYLQCFDTVGWAPGRASGLKKRSDEVLAWLSVWSEVQMIGIWSS